VNGPARGVDEIIRLLVVDEDLPTRQATMEGLRRRGYQVVGARDSLQALQHLQRAQVAVVITEIQIPRMDGVALLREMQRLGDARIVV
jgi:chemosensory pili system protein ChpA (sensor histidine kinase/response regulator)